MCFNVGVQQHKSSPGTLKYCFYTAHYDPTEISDVSHMNGVLILF